MMAVTRPFGINGRHRPAAGPPGTGGLGVVIRCRGPDGRRVLVGPALPYDHNGPWGLRINRWEADEWRIGA
jgi:hypothetical protein